MVFEEINPNVLIIDDDPQVARVVLKVLAGRGIGGTVAPDYRRAMEYIGKDMWSLVFVNPRTASEHGREELLCLLRRIKGNRAELPVVLLGQGDSVSYAISAVKTGYTDFASKPLSEDEVGELVDWFVPNHRTATLAAGQDSGRVLFQIVGSSRQLARTVELAEKVAGTAVPVLISGPTGSGKELIAQLIHYKSQRSGGSFVKVNCAALNESLLESELFGHEKGAFTGAFSMRKGRFELADGGTLLLDEITETPAAFQAKLLRVLEQMHFERVGGSESIGVNVRVISTTNADISGLVGGGRFRADLYYRLAGVRIHVPGLRERVEDIECLVWFYVNKFAPESRRKITGLEPSMMELFRGYHWPGNVRQLRNVVRGALILGSGPVLGIEDASWLAEQMPVEGIYGKDCAEEAQKTAGVCGAGRKGLGDGVRGGFLGEFSGKTLEELEEDAIIRTLGHTGGNQARAANLLGISDRTLREKVKKYRQREALPV